MNSELFLRKIRRHCESGIRRPFDLRVIDVYRQIELAKDDEILATPTLIRVFPPPPRRIVGNLSGLSSFLAGAGK